MPTAADVYLSDNPDIEITAEIQEIVSRAEVDIRRIVPLKRKVPVYRHLSAERELEPVDDKPEVGNIDDRRTTDADHLQQQPGRFPNNLQCAVENHVIVASGAVFLEPFIKVSLEYADSLLQARPDRTFLDIDTSADAVAGVAQVLQELAIAAPEIENSRTRFYEFANLGHTESLCNLWPIGSAATHR